ncbi:hypothetical protein [Mangrovivirga cuniculi]|uniref:Uncharacterized protein n=1 Tax=Mangrovivirga cuniculi TaxID=2715131 RepID=A0A4D7JFT4_9BACT|nr:hypothetical protein [Mangrovivirga cuniculi]QCK14491.1 hypothetical protein DCC35_06920 [Mangrovivirga cuniculi]
MMNKSRFGLSMKIVSKKEHQLNGYLVIFYLSKDGRLLVDVIDEESDSHSYIEGFLHHWSDFGDIKEDLIPMIDSVKNGYSVNEFVSSEISCAYIESETTFFIHESDIGEGKIEAAKDPNRHMPTSIFEKIILKWVEFLESQGR